MKHSKACAGIPLPSQAIALGWPAAALTIVRAGSTFVRFRGGPRERLRVGWSAVTLEPDPGHSGGGTGTEASSRKPCPGLRLAPGDPPMTVHVEKPKGLPHTVTTGPIQGSRKVYAGPTGRPD